MDIGVVSPEEVLASCRQTLGLPPTDGATLDDALLATLLRHAAGIHCPCSRTTLRAALLASLQYLGEDEPILAEHLERVTDFLIMAGDLLELNDVATADEDVKGTWVFAAPPSYVRRSDGRIVVTGVVSDQDTYLPSALTGRIVHKGSIRIIAPEPGEDLAAALRAQGLQELSEDVWLKSPGVRQPKAVLADAAHRLEAQPPSGQIPDLEILDPDTPPTYYRGRWTAPGTRSGMFVARRPQEFGAPIWCLVRLEHGSAERLLDLPLKKSRWRACDEAWHIQMAVDFDRGHPQLFRRYQAEQSVRFDFFSPLPQWSERRFLVFGASVPRDRCLMSYELPPNLAEAEEQFLTERLWLSRRADSD